MKPKKGLGSATLVNGAATVTSRAHAGQQVVTAVYAGDANFVNSTSAPHRHVVNK